MLWMSSYASHGAVSGASFALSSVGGTGTTVQVRPSGVRSTVHRSVGSGAPGGGGQAVAAPRHACSWQVLGRSRHAPSASRP